MAYPRVQLWAHFCFYSVCKYICRNRLTNSQCGALLIILICFLTSDCIQNLESVMKYELKLIYKYCALNKLSINFSKTNYILISSSRCHPRITIGNMEQKDYIKYLGGIYPDKYLNWQPQIQHINDRIVKNIGILTKLRYCLNFNSMGLHLEN